MPAKQRNVRVPDALWESAEREAKDQEMNTSEFVRQAIAVRLAWTAAIKMIQAGLDPEDALDLDKLAQLVTSLVNEDDEDPE